MEIQECVIDLKYEQDHYRFKYPMELPHIMSIKDPFIREKNTINLTVLLRTGKKYKKIARANLNFYKKYFLTEKMTIDKWIHLELFQTQLEEMGHNTNILKAVINTGKIFMKAQLIDSSLADELKPSIEKADNITIYSSSSYATAITNILKNNLKNLPNVKDKTTSNKTEKFRSITENTNEFLRNLKDRKIFTEDLFEDIDEEDEKAEEFNDSLSDISISDIDVTEKNHIEIDKMNLEIDILVNNVKNVFEEKFDELVPKDPKEIKFFIQNLSDLINQIAINYSSNLNAITEANKRIRTEAKEYYERYKDLKKDFTKKRRELKKKNQELEEKNKEFEEENLQVGKNLDDLKLELNFFKQLIGIDKDNDVILMANILDSLKNDVNIFEGLTPDQIDLVKEAIKNYVVKEKDEDGNKMNKNENSPFLDDEDRISEDEMTRLVENEVNMIYGMDLIRVMDIKSIPNNYYYFDEIKVRLGAFKGVLYVLNFEGQDRLKLTDFIQDKFPKKPLVKNNISNNGNNNLTKSPQDPTKKNQNQNAQKTTHLDALIDKKLTEKKQSLAQNNLPSNTKKSTTISNVVKK